MEVTHSMKVLLLGGDKVSAFNKEATQCSFPVFLCSGKYRINGKSLIGIFSLDLSKPIRVEVSCSDEEAAAFFEKLQPLSAESGKVDEKTEKPKKKRFSLFG